MATTKVFETQNNTNYAIKLSCLSNPRYFQQSFGGQIDALKSIKKWKETAKTVHVDAKGKSTLQAVKLWIRLNDPKQFYARWTVDSRFHKDDSVELFYL